MIAPPSSAAPPLIIIDHVSRRYVRGVLAKPLDLEQLRSLLGSSPKPTAPQPNASGMH